MALESILNLPKKDKESGLATFAKLLGIGIQLGNIAAGASGMFGGGAPSGPSMPQGSYGLLSPLEKFQVNPQLNYNILRGMQDWGGPIIGGK